MKRTYLLSLCLLVLTMASAQTQQGVVKTKGRMVNGQLQPGTKLSGAVIAVRGRSAVLSQNNGKFSFATNGQHSFPLFDWNKLLYDWRSADGRTALYPYSLFCVGGCSYPVCGPQGVIAQDWLLLLSTYAPV